MKSQIQMFYEEQRKIANLNAAFNDLVADGMTKEDLQACIARRPALYMRFEGFLSSLPSQGKSA